MKKYLVTHVFLCISSWVLSQNQKPNIILFLIDDMGWQDCSVPFYKEKTKWNEIYHTPNMERLAASGVKMTHAYSAAVCTPTRVSLLTGMNPTRHRVTNWTLRKNTPTDSKSDFFEIPKWNMNGLTPVSGLENAVYATTLPSVLKQNGYFNIHVGKAHFGALGTLGADPRNLGFDINIGGTAAGQPGSYRGLDSFRQKNDKENIWWVPNLQKYWGKDIFITEALTKEAQLALDTARQTGKPFFLYFGQYAVHTPIMADNRFVQKYYDKGLDTIEAKYASLIEGMDKSLGDIMDYLDKNNLVKNTIIIFTSDNGGLSAVARGGKPNTHNTPLRSGKGSAYEGGVRVPFIVKWPSVLEAGTTNAENIIVEDLFPTILNMAGVSKPKTVQTLDGENAIPIFKKKKSNNRRYFYWHYPNVWGPKGAMLEMYSAIRQGDWKLIYAYNDQHFELYNTATDISETQNLFEKHRNIAQKLAKKLGQRLRECGSDMPVDKKTKQKVPYPDEKI